MELQLLFEKLVQENEQRKIDMENLKQQHMIDNQQQNIKLENLKRQSSVVANTTTTNNHIQNNSNNNNTTNNININMYGQEDMSHISEGMYKECFRLVYKSVEKLFGMKHFSDDMKQNHNLYVTNMNSDHMMMLIKGDWDLVNKEETFDTIYDDIRENLSDAFNQLRDKNRIDSKLEKQFSSFADDYKVDDDENEERAKKESCKKMAYLAFNKRQFPIDAQKQSKLIKK